MLTGKKAFEGKTRASLLGAIMHAEPPPVSQVQPVAPAALNRIVATCLAKDPDDRWQSARDLMRELKWVADGSAAGATGAIGAESVTKAIGARGAMPWAVAGLACAAAATILVLWAPWRTVPLHAPLRMSVELGADVSLTASYGSTAILSPDGSALAFVAQKGDSTTAQMYVRRLDQLRATPLSGTDGARDAFFSPDGQWIAFFADSKLKKISITGGAAVTLCDVPNDRGGTWADDGTIVFQPDPNNGLSLMRVSSAGGKAEAFVKPAEGGTSLRWPQMLPGGRAVLYTAGAGGGFQDANIVVQPLPGGTPKVVQRGGYYAHYLPSGHLVYLHDGTLFAAPFSLERLELTGQAVPVVEGVSGNTGNGGAQFAVSESGTLVYVPGQSIGFDAAINWMDRMGKTTVLRAASGNWSNPHFSPDGQRLAIDIADGKQIDVWVYEWARDTATKLTFDPANDAKPVWTPDGRRIVFASSRGRGGATNLYWQHADGTGDAQRLTESANTQLPGSWHPSGKFLAFQETNPQTGNDLMVLPVSGDEASGWKPGKPTVFLSTPAAEVEPMFSPDGRWLAYQSNETGRFEVYVRPFPGPGGKWQISTASGGTATWSRGRRELFYRGDDNRIMVASYTVEGDSFRADKPRLWSERPLNFRPRQRVYDLHPDGDRMALAATADSPQGKQDKVVFIFNFFDELRRLAPTGPQR
jgi:serine/threonine-protein kinase